VTAEQILRAAAERLRSHGWTKEAYGSWDGPCCIVGAIAVASGVRPGPLADYPSSLEAAKVVGEVVGTGIPHFNDHHCRSIHDAIAALEIAADLAAPEWKP